MTGFLWNQRPLGSLPLYKGKITDFRRLLTSNDEHGRVSVVSRGSHRFILGKSMS